MDPSTPQSWFTCDTSIWDTLYIQRKHKNLKTLQAQINMYYFFCNINEYEIEIRPTEWYLISNCQVFNLYVWESEAEEHLRSYSCIAVTSFFRSQCHCFRDSWYLKIVSKVATPRRGSCLNSSRLEPLLSKGHMMPQVLYEPVRSQLVDNSPLVTVVC